MRRLLLTAVVLLAAAVAPAAASAQSPAPSPAVRFAVGSAPMLAAQAIARDTWGTDACGGNVNVVWDVLAPNYNALSTWSNPTDSYANPLANFGCTIELNSAMTYDWPKFCTVVVHEYGHLDGQQHSADPHSVMAAVYGGPLAACAAMPEPGVAAAPVAAPVAKAATKTKVAPAQKRATNRKAAKRTTAR